jgi:phosphate-selective porin OprO/OprP
MLTSSVRTGRLILLAAFVALPATWPITARGQSPQASDVDRRLKELEETVDRLKKDQRQTEVNLENQKPLAGWSAADGFTLTSPDGKLYKLRLGGYTQFDGRFFIHEKSASGVTDQFLFRRARIDLQGTVFKYFDFRILPDFAPSTPILFDAYLDANYIPEAKLRFGKFKPPVGLERLQGVRYIEFIERAQPTNLVPNRDFGVQLFGDLVNGILGYQLAIVNGVPDNSNPSTGDVNNDKDFDGRFFVLPFKNTSFDPGTRAERHRHPICRRTRRSGRPHSFNTMGRPPRA